MPSVLVDSSVWIAVLRDPNDPDAARLRHMIAAGVVTTTGVIRAEIVPFVKKDQIEKTTQLFASLPEPMLSPQKELWAVVVCWRTRMMRAGLAGIALPDAVIAAIAMETDTPLWTRDKHFSAVASRLPLQRWLP